MKYDFLLLTHRWIDYLLIYFVIDALVHIAFKSSKAISIFSKSLLSSLHEKDFQKM